MLVIAKTLLGKYALYKWIKSGSNAGITGNVGLGPFKVSGSAGFDAGPAGGLVPKNLVEDAVREYWYEPIDVKDGDFDPIDINEKSSVSATNYSVEMVQKKQISKS